MFINRYLAIIIILIGTEISYGQSISGLFTDDHDTNYIESYKNQLTTRLYTSRKYTGLRIRDVDNKTGLRYNPNDRLNLGFGATYNAFTLNIGINFPFVNDDDKEYGKTDYLDLQSHMLFRKISVEVYFSSFRGYYISNPDKILLNHKDTGEYPQRRDILSIDLGAKVYYIFNYKRFSYRAAFNQDERQKKSAGSFLAGPAVFTTYFQGDSSIIPYNVNPPDFIEGVKLKRSRYANVAICAGYAYNLIVLKRFFITASFIAGPAIGWGIIYTEDDDIEGIRNVEFGYIHTFRAGAGYNSKRFYLGMSYVNTTAWTHTPIKSARYLFKRGNIRFNLVYRFQL